LHAIQDTCFVVAETETQSHSVNGHKQMNGS